MLDVAVSPRTAALAYWQGRYVAIDQDEDAAKLAEVSVPARVAEDPARDWLGASEPAELPQPGVYGAGALAIVYLARSADLYTGRRPMKRLATWAFYAVGALAIAYLALYAYAVFTGRDLQPGDPIHIFRKPDAPSYSVRPLPTPPRQSADTRRRPPA